MRRLSEVLVRLALLSCVVMVFIVFSQPTAALVLCALLAVSLLPLRAQVDRIGQVILSLAALALAWTLVSVVGPLPPRAAFDPFVLVRAVLSTWVLATAAARLFFTNAVGGPRGTVSLMLIAVLACGGERWGAIYVGFVALFFALALGIMASADVGRPALTSLTTRRRLLLLGATVTALTLACAAITFLPVAYAYAVQRFEANLMEQTETEFGVSMELGALDSLLQSDTVVLRVRGGQPVYLRGAVYDRYLRGTWATPRGGPLRLLPLPRTAPRGAKVVTIEHVGGRGDRYFVPLGAGSVFARQGALRADAFGLYYPAADETASTVELVQGGQDAAVIALPTALNLELPHGIRADLVAIAARFTSQARTPAHKLAAIERELASRYQYALAFERTEGAEPLLDFLQTHRVGHCEYFASALALLARAVGVSTRVVGGYAVIERNTLGDYFVVREKHAHAWVEAWLEGQGWVTIDPTPPSGRAATLSRQTPWVWALFDVLRGGLGAGLKRILQMTAAELAGAVAALVGTWLAVRLVRGWRQRRAGVRAQPQLYTDPLPAITALLDRLVSLGVPHQPSEPLERYAVRLGDLGTPGVQGAEAGRIITRYVQYRYGQQGDPIAIAKDVAAWLAAEDPRRD